MARITRQIKDFLVGMTPDVYGQGLSRIEHFNAITPQLRPFRELSVSTMFADTVIMGKLAKFVKGTSGILYALGIETSSARAAMAKWNQGSYRWDGFQAFDAAGTAAEVLHFYNGNLYGLWKGTHLWKMTTGGTFSGTFAAITYTTTCDFITHSKDGLVYLATDNILSSFNGTTITAVLTFPTNFIITSIAEKGDFIAIIGYDSQTTRATAFLWDRDSSLATLTAKYDLGDERPYHAATIGGTSFIISLKTDSSNSVFAEKLTLVIRYITGDKAKILKEYVFDSLAVGGKYITSDKIYFNAAIVPVGLGGGSHWVTFQLDENGKLSIAQNVGINDAAGARADHPGIYRDGDAFWHGGGADGQWDTIVGYATTSFFETTKYVSPNMVKSIDTIGGVVTFEPLPSGATVVVKTRKDEETAWTTVRTFSTTNSVKGVFGEIMTAKERQFRVESTGGATITGWQVDFEEKDDELYS